MDGSDEVGDTGEAHCCGMVVGGPGMVSFHESIVALHGTSDRHALQMPGSI